MTPMSRVQKRAALSALIGSSAVYAVAEYFHKRGQWNLEIVLVPIAFFVLYPGFRFLFARYSGKDG